jgi:hypothetical protein
VLSDLRVIRKIALSDINRLEMTILRGDPFFSFVRDAYARSRAQMGPPAFGDPGTFPALPEDSENVLWLREQFESGALPRDPQLIRSLLEQSKRDPQLIERLVAGARDADGNDVYARLKLEPQDAADADEDAARADGEAAGASADGETVDAPIGASSLQTQEPTQAPR